MEEIPPEKKIIEFKIIFLGDSGVGKSTMIRQFINDDFNPNQLSTLGVLFSTKVLTINNKQFNFKLINTSSQEKYKSMSIPYLKHVDIVLFVFDLNSTKSFDNIQYWIDFFNKNNDGISLKGKYLIGNKSDLEQNVEQNLIDQIIKKNELLYLSINAKAKSQIEQMFEYIIENLYEHVENNEKNKCDKNDKKGKFLSKDNIYNGKKKKNRCV